MKFVPIPKFPCTPEELAAFRAAVNMPGNIATFPAQQVSAGIIYASGELKPWRDNSTIWQPGRQSFEYIVQRGEVVLKLRPRQSDAGTVTVDAEGIGELDGFYSGPVIEFYNRRFIQSGGKEFGRIPRLIRVTVDRAEASRLSIMTPPAPTAVEWPISVPIPDGHSPNSIPVKTALMFASNGSLVAFDIDEYERENPLVVGAISDQELVDSVTAIIATPMPVSEKAKAIRLVAR